MITSIAASPRLMEMRSAAEVELGIAPDGSADYRPLECRPPPAIADAGPLATILQAVKVREQRRDAIRSELKTLALPRHTEVRDTAAVRAELTEIPQNLACHGT